METSATEQNSKGLPTGNAGVDVLDPTKIGYVDAPHHEYVSSLANAKSLEALKAVGVRFSRLFSDAAEIIASITDADFAEFRRGLLCERKGKFAGEEWAAKYGAVTIPRVGMFVGLYALKMHVPFGLVFNRMRDVGQITIEDGVVVYRHPTEMNQVGTPSSETRLTE